MADEQPPTHLVERPGPSDFYSRSVRDEARKAAVWLGMALAIVGVIVLSQPILLILGGMIFAVILDGGTRLLGRVLPIGRGWRLAIVTLAGFAFVGWVFYFAGSTLAGQAEALRVVVAAAGDSACSISPLGWASCPKAEAACKASASSCWAASVG